MSTGDEKLAGGGGSLRLSASPFVPTLSSTPSEPKPGDARSKLSELVTAAPFVPGGGVLGKGGEGECQVAT